MRFADLLGGVVVLLFGLSIVFFSSQLPYMSEYGPAPAVAPLAGRGSRRLRHRHHFECPQEAGQGRGLFQAPYPIGIQMLVMIVVAFLFLPLLGFSVGLALFTAVSMRIIGKHGLGVRPHVRGRGHRHSFHLRSMAEHPASDGHRGLVDKGSARMDLLQNLYMGFSISLTPTNILYCLAGLSSASSSACCRASGRRPPWPCSSP